MMIYAINYANAKFKYSRKLNSRNAKKWGADVVIEYSEKSLDKDFKVKNAEILKYSRGNGYWIWKSYIISKTLQKMEFGDYLVYTDSGSCFIGPIKELIASLEKSGQDLMCFEIDQIEKKWDKRDALLLMDCDKSEFLDTFQRCASFCIIKKTNKTLQFVEEYFNYSQDRRIITNEENVLGVDNYDCFIENRHDQTIWSLLTKKYGYEPFRDPSIERNCTNNKSVEDRSDYPQVIYLHRIPDIHWEWELKRQVKMLFVIRTVLSRFRVFRRND